MVDFFFGEAAFARPSNTQRVNQGEKVVERWIAPGGTGHTIDLGLWQTRPAGGTWTEPQFRGWGGSRQGRFAAVVFAEETTYSGSDLDAYLYPLVGKWRRGNFCL